LDTELAKVSVVKVIVSGVQVLHPTDQTRALSTYCSYDGASGTFVNSISAVGESSSYLGTSYESWGEMPQERAKLLGKAQKAINDGKAKVIVFASGDQHWAELMAKRMPASTTYGDPQVLYEVTASGIHQNWNEAISNSNRLRTRTCDNAGTGPMNKACIFPFIYGGVTYNACTGVGNGGVLWCSTKTDSSNVHVAGFWGNCAPVADELAQLAYSNSSKTCTQSKFHVCTATANYGGVKVDFAQKKVRMSVQTPHHLEEAYHEVTYV
jgi:alkaline phosphatase D